MCVFCLIRIQGREPGQGVRVCGMIFAPDPLAEREHFLNQLLGMRQIAMLPAHLGEERHAEGISRALFALKGAAEFPGMLQMGHGLLIVALAVVNRRQFIETVHIIEVVLAVNLLADIQGLSIPCLRFGTLALVVIKRSETVQAVRVFRMPLAVGILVKGQRLRKIGQS